MPTGSSKVNIYEKRLLERSAIKDNFLDFLAASIDEVTAAMFQGQSGVLDEDEIEINSTLADTFTLDTTNASRVIVGGGQIIDLSLRPASLYTQVPFENLTGQYYHVGIKFMERPDGIELNPRTGDPEYPRLLQTYGEMGAPDLVTDNTTYIRLYIDSITDHGSGEDHSGRIVRVWLVDPVSGVESTAYFEDASGNDGNNYVDIPYTSPDGPLGQDTGVNPPSTTASDYVVSIEGPSWRNGAHKDLRTDTDYAFIGIITGLTGSIPVGFDISDQQPIFLITLDRAYDGPAGGGSGRRITVDAEAVELRGRAGGTDELHATFRIDRKSGVEDGGICLQTICDEGTDGKEACQVHLMPLTHGVGNLLIDEPGSSSAADIITLSSGVVDLTLSGLDVRCDLVWLQGFSTIDGLYTMVAFTTNTVTLRTITGGVPTFPFPEGPATVTFLRVLQVTSPGKWGGLSNPILHGAGGTAFKGTNESIAPSAGGGNFVHAAVQYYCPTCDQVHYFDDNVGAPKVQTWVSHDGELRTIRGIVIVPDASNPNGITGLGLYASGWTPGGLAALDWMPTATDHLGIVADPASVAHELTEPSGRRATPHHFKDDFHYHENKWTNAATAPIEYAATIGGAGAQIFMGGSNPSWEDICHGGVAIVQTNVVLDTALLEGAFAWWIDPSKWFTGFLARVALGYEPALANDRILQVGLYNQTSSALIYFEIDGTTHGNENWWIVCKSGANTVKADTGFGAQYDGGNNEQFSNLQFQIIGTQAIRYGTSEMGAPATLDLTTAAPGAIDLSAIANPLMAPYLFLETRDPTLLRAYLDRWEVWDQQAVSLITDGNQVY